MSHGNKNLNIVLVFFFQSLLFHGPCNVQSFPWDDLEVENNKVNELDFRHIHSSHGVINLQGILLTYLIKLIMHQTPVMVINPLGMNALRELTLVDLDFGNSLSDLMLPLATPSLSIGFQDALTTELDFGFLQNVRNTPLEVFLYDFPSLTQLTNRDHIVLSQLLQFEVSQEKMRSKTQLKILNKKVKTYKFKTYTIIIFSSITQTKPHST